MDAVGLRLGKRLLNGPIDDRRVHGVFLGDGVGHQHAALEAQLQAGLEGRRQLLGAVHLVVHGKAAVPGVEGGQFAGAVAQHGHAVGLQVLQGQSQIQNGFGPGAHHHHGGMGQLLQVGGDVHGGLRPPVDAADAAGGEYLDARHVGDNHGGGDGGGPVLPTGAQHGQVPAAGLGDLGPRLAQVLNLLPGAPGLQLSADDGDGGGHRAVLPDDGLHRQGGLHVLGVGHAVRDDGGLQGHHRLSGGKGPGHLGGYVQILV